MIVKSTSRSLVQAARIMLVLILLRYSIGLYVSEMALLQKLTRQSTDRRPLSPSEFIQQLLNKSNSNLQDQSQAVGLESPQIFDAAFSTTCDQFPNTEDVLLVMKTGATEAYEKLPIHFLTTMKCLNDSIVFSDTNMQMGDHQIIDALEDIDGAEIQEKELALYQQLKQYEELELNPQYLSDPKTGWDLDKYKFVPILKKSWKYRQDAKWYIFIEADTAINWSNMRRFLDMLNPEQPLYIGSPTNLDGVEFAHGGTGYIISGAAMKKAVGDEPNIQELYGTKVKDLCCGDRMPADILLDKGIKLTKAWPMFNGETPLSVNYGDQQWCQPVITMHHMTSFQVSQLWSFEQDWKVSGQERPMLWMDVYDRFVHPNLEEERANWANSASDTVLEEGSKELEQFSESSIERASIQSPGDCKRLCEQHSECISWEHHDKTCSMGRGFSFGKSRLSEEHQWTSGWLLERVAQFRGRMGNCSQDPDWTYTKPEAPQ